ncbi:Conserved serine proline-rich [Pyrenophora seminiperda CCB06]|uniref:Conserved serine proline-rich n=1 Tax=Pyrenophora seminiperda CCB06 TaxID=1302712 RepID=A0A3M7MJB3_9PLEO|nr:Conserved serine proline-rich [Pyrenophora seminiperda CCB06]
MAIPEATTKVASDKVVPTTALSKAIPIAPPPKATFPKATTSRAPSPKASPPKASPLRAPIPRTPLPRAPIPIAPLSIASLPKNPLPKNPLPKALPPNAPTPRYISSLLFPLYKLDTEVPKSSTRIKREEDFTPTQHLPDPVDGTLKSLSPIAKVSQGSLQLDLPCSNTFREPPRCMCGNLTGKFANFSPKRKVKDAFPMQPKIARRGFFAEAFIADMQDSTKVKVEEGASDVDEPEPKKIKLEREDSP